MSDKSEEAFDLGDFGGAVGGQVLPQRENPAPSRSSRGWADGSARQRGPSFAPIRLRLQCFRPDGPEADLARDHNMDGNRRVALAGALERVQSAPLPCRVALPIILVISLAAWRSLCPLPMNHGSPIVHQAKSGCAGGEEIASGSGDRCTKSAARIQKRSSRRSVTRAA